MVFTILFLPRNVKFLLFLLRIWWLITRVNLNDTINLWLILYHFIIQFILKIQVCLMSSHFSRKFKWKFLKRNKKKYIFREHREKVLFDERQLTFQSAKWTMSWVEHIRIILSIIWKDHFVFRNKVWIHMSHT